MNSINEMMDLNIPQKCPKIGTKRIKAETLTVQLKGDPFHMGAYEPGDEFVACDYDMPSGKLSQIIRGQTSGPLMYRGVKCIEITENQYDPEGVAQLQTRRIVHRSSRFTHTVLSIARRSNGSGMIEKLDLKLPLSVYINGRWNVREMSQDQPTASTSLERVDGLYKIHIGKRSETCIRWLRTRQGDVPYEEAEETFISTETGLPILLRHYLGTGWSRLDELRLSHKIEIEGSIFHLWFVRRVTRGLE